MAGMNSGFSGASRARSSARRTTRSSAASSNSLIVAVPTRLPKATCTASSVSSTMPLVDTLLSAKRMLPAVLPVSCAVHSSAFDSATTLSRMALARSSVNIPIANSPENRGRKSAEAACGVEDVDAGEACGAGAVRDRRHLRGLALAVEERAAQAVVAAIADRLAGVPEFGRADLVGHVLDHARDLAGLDLVEQLAAELCVVALLVDRVGAAADDVDAVLDVGDHLRRRQRLLARLQRHVGHALELHAAPGIGVGAALRRIQADDVRLVAGRLVVHQDAVADQVPALRRHALVVEADRAERVRLGTIGHDADLVAAIAEILAAPLVERGEAGAGVVGLVAEHAVELQRVADRFVDGQEKMTRIEHKVVLARLDRRRLELGLRVARRGYGVGDDVV